MMKNLEEIASALRTAGFGDPAIREISDLSRTITCLNRLAERCEDEELKKDILEYRDLLVARGDQVYRAEGVGKDMFRPCPPLSKPTRLPAQS